MGEPQSFQDLIAEFDRSFDDPLKQAELIQRAAKMAKSDIEQFEVATRYQGLKERTGYPGP